MTLLTEYPASSLFMFAWACSAVWYFTKFWRQTPRILRAVNFVRWVFGKPPLESRA